MDDLEIMQRAKTYIDKMANGINPVTDREAAETDVINNVRVSRCLFFVSDVLRQLIENGGVPAAQDGVPNAKKKKEPFCLTDAQLTGFRFSEDPIPIKEITERFNELADEGHVKLTYTTLTSWLISVGLLQEMTAKDGKQLKRPTDQGQALGIVTEKRLGRNGEFTAVYYKKDAQRFIVDHLDAVLSHAAEEKQKKEASKTGNAPERIKAENEGLPWTKEQEDLLLDLYLKNVSVPEIAATMKRSENAIKARLKKLGLAD